MIGETMGRGKQKVFAVYRGDTFIDVGTLKELSPRLNVKESTIRYYISQAYQRRMAKSKNGHYENRMIAISFYEDEESEDVIYAN